MSQGGITGGFSGGGGTQKQNSGFSGSFGTSGQSSGFSGGFSGGGSQKQNSGANGTTNQQTNSQSKDNPVDDLNNLLQKKFWYLSAYGTPQQIIVVGDISPEEDRWDFLMNKEMHVCEETNFKNLSKSLH